ncbi:Colicin I receptor precursor [compost metagenome]
MTLIKQNTSYPHILWFGTALTLALTLKMTNSQAQNSRFIGQVSNEQGQTLPGVTIEIEPDKRRSQSDGKGNFAIEKLYPGIYQVYIKSVGYAIHQDTVLINFEKTSRKNFILHPQSHELDEVLVNKSVSDRESPGQLIKLDRAAMPVHIIDRQTIERMGSRRLDEVLKEQTGMAIVNNIAGGSRSVGVQMQGFGSEYIMILIDGQPMVGRNNGNFDLSRISVSNIERIEIVKGASSCLFGSDALGGAINIITRYGAVEPQAQLAFNYGSFNMIDASLDAQTGFANQRGSIQVATNYYRTDGFNTNPYLLSGQSSPPYRNFDSQVRLQYQLQKNTILSSSLRYGTRTSDMAKNWDGSWQAIDQQQEKDINYAFTLDHTLRSGLRSTTRYYLSHYNVNQSNRWKEQSVGGQLQFSQDIHRFEQQFARTFRDGLQLTGGLGAGLEKANDQAIEGGNTMSNFFAFVQGDKNVIDKIVLRGGLRYDRTNSYGGKLNPSLGLQYNVHQKLSFKTGIGAGFKAPDYRMRYLVFYNPSANYMVIGNEVLDKTLSEMQESGAISEIFALKDQLSGKLKAEKSTSYNLGANWKPHNNLNVEGGLFYHYIKDQINAIPIATGTGISQIYTYQNLPKTVNKGLELNVRWDIGKDLSLTAGYQYLLSKDLSVEDSIRRGGWPYNQNLHDPSTGQSFTAKPSDYWGIVNRSRHMLNASIFYRFVPWNLNISLRANYRGKYAFTDYNNNGFIDRFDTLVPHHLLLNTHLDKGFYQDRLHLKLTLDNLLDFKHQLMPGQPGRVIIAGLSYRFSR